VYRYSMHLSCIGYYNNKNKKQKKTECYSNIQPHVYCLKTTLLEHIDQRKISPARIICVGILGMWNLHGASSY